MRIAQRKLEVVKNHDYSSLERCGSKTKELCIGSPMYSGKGV